MKTSIFIRSYDKDFEWLAYCLKSLQKFATGFHEIVIAVPQGHEHALRHLTAERVVPVHDAQPGYLGQQVSKLTADLHCSGDFILHIDSDCILTKPVTPDTFMEKGKARWLMTPWGAMGGEEKKAWFHVMAKCMQECPRFEYMRKSTIMVPRFAYAKFREFIQALHGITMEAYVMNQAKHEFSEYNCLGMFLHEHHPDSCHWHDTTKGIPEPWELQHWSWGGLTPEIRAKMEGILR